MKVKLNVWIVHITTHVYMEKWIDLPFAPFPGLWINDGEEEYRIRDVYFDLDDGEVGAWIKDEPACERLTSAESIIEQYEEAGWERV